MVFLEQVANFRQNPKAIPWNTVDELAYASPDLAELAGFLNLVCQNNKKDDGCSVGFEGIVLKDCLDRSQDKRVLLFQEEGEDSQRAAVMVDLENGVFLAMEVVNVQRSKGLSPGFGKRYLIQEGKRPLKLEADGWKIGLETIGPDPYIQTSIVMDRDGSCRLAYEVVKLSTNINGWNKLGAYAEASTLEASGARIVKGIGKFGISKSNSTSLHITMSEKGLEWSGKSPRNQGEDVVLPDFCVRTYNKSSCMVAFILGQEHFHLKLHHNADQTKLETLQRQVKAGTISGREILLALADLMWTSCDATRMTAEIWPIVKPS